MKHKDSYMRCLVAHYDKEGNPLPACMLCANCGEWIAYDEYDSECKRKEKL